MGDSAEKQKRPSFFKGAKAEFKKIDEQIKSLRQDIEAIRSGCCNFSCSWCDYCSAGLFYSVRRKLLNIIIERG